MVTGRPARALVATVTGRLAATLAATAEVGSVNLLCCASFCPAWLVSRGHRLGH